MALQDQLRELSGLDRRVRGMRSRLDSATRRKNAQQRKLAQLQQQAEELTAEHKRVQAHAGTLESESQAAEDRVTSLRDRMNAVTSNKEYSALLVEVNTLKSERSKLEDEALAEITKVEELQTRLNELNEKIDQQQKVVESSEGDVKEAAEAVGDQLTELTAERDQAAASIPDDVIDAFDKLNDIHDGEAVCGIEEQNRKRMEYICAGCYIQIPVEHVNALMTKPDALTTCPACGRILLIDEELRTALAK